MSLTLNVSKEAKLFYKNERKSRESVEERIMQPSATIHMKKYSPRRMSNHSTFFENSDDQSSDDSLMESNVIKRRRLQAQRKSQKISPSNTPIASHYSFRDNRHAYAANNNFDLDKSLKYKRRGKRDNVEKWRQDQMGESEQQKSKQKHVVGNKNRSNEIPSRDLNGEGNDSDEMHEDVKPDNDPFDDISPAQDVWNLDEDLLEIDRDEKQNISENNPFAKQRILKSKYKNMYSS